MSKNAKITFTSITQDMFTLLSAIMTNEYHDGRDPIGSSVWTSSLEHGFTGSKVGGLIGSAKEAGWLEVGSDEGDDQTIAITQKGADVRALFVTEIKEGLKARVRSDAKGVAWANDYADTMAITRKKEAEAKEQAERDAEMAKIIAAAKASDEAAKKMPANDTVDGKPVYIQQTENGPVIHDRSAKRVTFSGELRASGVAKLTITGDGHGSVQTELNGRTWVGKMNPGEAHPNGDKLWTIGSLTSLTQAWKQV